MNEKNENLESDEAIAKSDLSSLLCGALVKAKHPITPLNPTETFIVKEAKIERNKLFMRGENTMWFAHELLEKASA